MIVVLTLCYLGCVLLAFKVIKFKVRPLSVAVAVMIGVLLLGGVVIGWKLSAPMSGRVIVNRDVVQLLAGQGSMEMITKIYVPANQPVKKGELLYEVDSRPNQYQVDLLAAQLAVGQQKVLELEAGVEVAEATAEQAQAASAYAEAQYETSRKSHELNPGAVAELQLTVQQQQAVAAQAAVEQANAAVSEARFALASASENVKATEAQLGTAKLNLQQCQVHAPTDGIIVNWQAVEGTMASTVSTAAQGTFMDMSETAVAAVLPECFLRNVQSGDTVEIAFMNRPGQITRGKVDQILEFTGEGQFAPSGLLPVAKDVSAKGVLAVRIVLDDQQQAAELPLGVGGTVAIYTQSGRPFHMISKITLRMKAWMYYAPI